MCLSLPELVSASPSNTTTADVLKSHRSSQLKRRSAICLILESSSRLFLRIFHHFKMRFDVCFPFLRSAKLPSCRGKKRNSVMARGGCLSTRNEFNYEGFPSALFFVEMPACFVEVALMSEQRSAQ